MLDAFYDYCNDHDRNIKEQCVVKNCLFLSFRIHLCSRPIFGFVLFCVMNLNLWSLASGACAIHNADTR